MDPNANVTEQNELRQRRHAYLAGEQDATWDRRDHARLRELTRALQEWLANGGFAPTVEAWEAP